MSDITMQSLDQRLRLVEAKLNITPPDPPVPPPVPPPAGIDVWRKPFSATTSPWNQKITSLGARGNAYFGSKHWPSRNAVPLFVQPATGGTTYTIKCPQATFSGRFYGVSAGIDGDRAICLVIGNDVWSLYNCSVSGSTISSALGIKCPLTGSGFGTAPGVKAGVRASGASLLGGLVTAQNLADRNIPHALAAAIPRACLSVAAPGYIWPAVSADSGWQTSYTGNVRMGSRWGISTATPCPSSNADCQTVWKALQVHGMFVLDADNTGISLYLERTGTTDTMVNTLGTIMAAIASSIVPVTSAA